jgi:uncharacterized protein (TIGR03435 family)
MRRAVAASVLGIAITATLAAQNATLPAFDALSVKPNTTDSAATSSRPLPGQLRIVNTPLYFIVLEAFGARAHQVAGLPDWTSDERFDIVGTAPAGTTPAQIGLMTQRALADRFQLRSHRETRDVPVYRLVLARGDKRLGPKLTPSTTNCEGGSTERRCRMIATRRSVAGGAQSMAALAPVLEAMTGRFVVDATGLTGIYDIDLQWTPDTETQAGIAAAPDTGPSIFTAIQEQLGLKLESARQSMDVLVIDSVSRPTPD